MINKGSSKAFKKYCTVAIAKMSKPQRRLLQIARERHRVERNNLRADTFDALVKMELLRTDGVLTARGEFAELLERFARDPNCPPEFEQTASLVGHSATFKRMYWNLCKLHRCRPSDSQVISGAAAAGVATVEAREYNDKQAKY